jgi:hypothetical protein
VPVYMDQNKDTISFFFCSFLNWPAVIEGNATGDKMTEGVHPRW